MRKNCQLANTAVKRLIAVLLAIATLPAGAAENWPEFRGPTGQGHSSQTNLPTSWSETENVAWKVPVPGKGYSSPIFVDGRIYLTTATSENADSIKADRSLRALCFDAADGEIIWDVEVFHQDGPTAPHINSRKNSHASPTPAAEGKRLYLHFGHQGTACLDFDGEIIWQTRELRYEPHHGNGGSPVLVDDKLIFSCDDVNHPFVAALDKRTGKVLWKTPRVTAAELKFSFSTALLIDVNGRKQVVSPGSGAVCAYAPDSGKEIWRVSYGEGWSLVPRPVYGHDLLFTNTGWGIPRLLAIRPDGKGDVTKTHVQWSIDKAVPQVPSLLLVGDELYAVKTSGVVWCVDARTGNNLWSNRVLGPCSASPLYADGKIYIQDETGRAAIIKPGKKFVKLGENKLDEPVFASYAVGDGALFIRGEEHLYRIGK